MSKKTINYLVIPQYDLPIVWPNPEEPAGITQVGSPGSPPDYSSSFSSGSLEKSDRK